MYVTNSEMGAEYVQAAKYREYTQHIEEDDTCSAHRDYSPRYLLSDDDLCCSEAASGAKAVNLYKYFGMKWACSDYVLGKLLYLFVDRALHDGQEGVLCAWVAMFEGDNDQHTASSCWRPQQVGCTSFFCAKS